jgi:hypothetical protein
MDDIIDATPVIAHLNKLLADGRTKRWIADTAGVPSSVVVRLTTGRSTRISAGNAERILAVDPAAPTTRTWGVDSTGTLRRIEALGTLGWGLPEIAAEAGVHTRTLMDIRSPQRRMRPATVRCVADAYERLSRRRREGRVATFVANRARRLGWAPPSAWTPDTIDDPTATPMTEVA